MPKETDERIELQNHQIHSNTGWKNIIQEYKIENLNDQNYYNYSRSKKNNSGANNNFIKIY